MVVPVVDVIITMTVMVMCAVLSMFFFLWAATLTLRCCECSSIYILQHAVGDLIHCDHIASSGGWRGEGIIFKETMNDQSQWKCNSKCRMGEGNGMHRTEQIALSFPKIQEAFPT